MSQSNHSSLSFTGYRHGLITVETLITVVTVLCYTFGPLFLLFGSVSNIFNMAVFAKMDIRDSVTLSFFVLASSDFGFSTVNFMEIVCLSLGINRLSGYVHIYSLAAYLAWYKALFLDMSLLTTVYIAVVRCCCVALPLTFKASFTVRRTAFVLASTTLACVVLRIPQLSSTGFAWQFDPVANMTLFKLFYTGSFTTINSILSVIDRTILPLTVLVIVSVCSFILTGALVKASKLRKQMTLGTQKVMNIPNITDQPFEQMDKATPAMIKLTNGSQKDSGSIPASSSENRDSGQQLSEKDVRLVKAVVWVTIFLLMSSFTMSVNGLAVAFLPEYFEGRRYGALYSLLIHIQNLSNQINASANIFIYWKLNTKFRTCFKNMIFKTQSDNNKHEF